MKDEKFLDERSELDGLWVTADQFSEREKARNFLLGERIQSQLDLVSGEVDSASWKDAQSDKK